jgi:hypothetical protein
MARFASAAEPYVASWHVPFARLKKPVWSTVSRFEGNDGEESALVAGVAHHVNGLLAQPRRIDILDTCIIASFPAPPIAKRLIADRRKPLTANAFLQDKQRIIETGAAAGRVLFGELHARRTVGTERKMTPASSAVERGVEVSRNDLTDPSVGRLGRILHGRPRIAPPDDFVFQLGLAGDHGSVPELRMNNGGYHRMSSSVRRPARFRPRTLRPASSTC